MARDYPRNPERSEEIPVADSRALRHRYHPRAELHCWEHSFPPATRDGRDVESGADAARQPDRRRRNAQGRNSLVLFTRARRRAAATVVTFVGDARDRKSTRLNSSHGYISYAVFCLKKKKN